MKTKGIEMLIPEHIYDDVTVHDGKIEVAGTVYQGEEFRQYNQQNIIVREYKDELILFDKNLKHIGEFAK